MGETQLKDNVAVGPSVEDAKETAHRIRSVGVEGIEKARRKRRTRAEIEAAETVVVAAPPGFAWTKDEVKLIGDAPFNAAYTWLGPDHEHWAEAREKCDKSQVYEKFATVLNKLKVQDPVYLVLALAVIEYGGALTQATLRSIQINRERREDKRNEEAETALGNK